MRELDDTGRFARNAFFENSLKMRIFELLIPRNLFRPFWISTWLSEIQQPDWSVAMV